MRRCAHRAVNDRGVNPDVHIFDDGEQLARRAAETFVESAAAATTARGKFLVALSGGSTPKAMFSLLATPDLHTRIDWPAVHVFWGDERLVPGSDPGSNYFHAQELLLSKVPIPPAQVHRVRGELAAPEAVEDYTAQLRISAARGDAWPHFDLALMGLGSDGHTASLFPESTASAEREIPVMAVTADYAGRPAQRVTLTPPVFNDARRVLFLVTGADKAAALAAVLNGPRDVQKWPAQSIQPASGTLTWYVDRAAAGQLNSR